MSILKNKNRKVQTNFLKKEDLIFNIESNLNLNDAAFYFPLLFFRSFNFFRPQKNVRFPFAFFSPRFQQQMVYTAGIETKKSR